MIFTRNNIKKKPIVSLVNLSPISNLKNPDPISPMSPMPVRFGYNMFEAVSKFSNCETCNKMN